jgi:hypothetical protein
VNVLIVISAPDCIGLMYLGLLGVLLLHGIYLNGPKLDSLLINTNESCIIVYERLKFVMEFYFSQQSGLMI